jgi:hypothetical protein
MDSCTFTDAKGTVNFFDKDRVSLLAKSIAPVIDYMWPKAKVDDIIELSDKALWMFLELSNEYDVLSPAGRSDVCERVGKELNEAYTHRCKPRVLKNNKKPSKKQLGTHEAFFIQYASVIAFIVYGDLKSKYKLVEA